MLQEDSLPLPQLSDTPLTRFQDHLAQARDIITGKGRGSSFAPETTTVGQLLLALEALGGHLLALRQEIVDTKTAQANDHALVQVIHTDLAQVQADLHTSTRKSVEEDARLRNRLLEVEQRVQGR